MKNKYLIIIQNDNIINDLKDLGVNLAFPLKSFSVGFTRYFDINEIPEDSYLYINKLLDNKDINTLDELLSHKSIKGIIFDDLGIIDIANKYSLEKIIYMPHQLTNSKSINAMLPYVDSLVIPTDITKNEIEYILNNANKPLVIFGFGYVSIMYSRRKLLSNYQEFHSLPKENSLLISEQNKNIITIESEDGTVLYDTPCTKNFEFNTNKNVKYVLINSLFINDTELIKLIKTNNTDINSYDGFLNKKTIYKLKEK